MARNATRPPGWHRAWRRFRSWPAVVQLAVVALLVAVVVSLANGAEPSSTGTDQAAPVDSPSIAAQQTSTTPASTLVRAPTSTSPPGTPPPTTTLPPAPPTTGVPAPRVEPPPSAPGAGSAALATLNSLPVGTKDTSHPYDRTGDFGPAWTDDNDDLYGHNGCGTRDDILQHALTNITFRPGTHNCVVVSGTLQDPYSGTSMPFEKAHASKIQIDHLVPLHAAWQLGAWQWSQEQRVNYANDPTVLIAVSGSLNEQKGDDLADEWLPPNTAFHCTYAERTVAIHGAYALPVTAGEKAALVRILQGC